MISSQVMNHYCNYMFSSNNKFNYLKSNIFRSIYRMIKLEKLTAEQRESDYEKLMELRNQHPHLKVRINIKISITKFNTFIIISFERSQWLFQLFTLIQLFSRNLYYQRKKLKIIITSLNLQITLAVSKNFFTDFFLHVGDKNIRKHFISNVTTYLQAHNFDGLDMHWIDLKKFVLKNVERHTHKKVDKNCPIN